MRRRSFAYLFPFLPLVLPLVHFACISSDKVAPPGLDAGAAGFDATAAEASTPDVDAGPLPVTVTVIRLDQKPIAGVHVVFQDATGAVLEDKITDANGSVSSFVPAGSQVTAVLGTTDLPRLLTLVGVEPGDDLRAVDSDEAFDRLLAAKLSFGVGSVPPSPPANTLSYTVQIGQCGVTSGTFPILVGLGQDCVGPGVTSLIATALDDSDTPVAFAYQKGVNLFDALASDAGPTKIAIGGGWQDAAVTTHSVNVTNTAVGDIGRLSFSELVGGIPVWQTAFFDDPPIDAGADATFKGHPGFPESLQTELSLERSDPGSNITYNAMAVREPPQAQTSRTFDRSQLLPTLTGAGLADGGAGRPTATWGSTASLANTDGMIVRFEWSKVGFGRASWTIVAPPTSTSVRAPELPSSVSAFAPAVDAAFENPPSIVFFEASFIASYAELRKFAADLGPMDPLIRAHIVPIVPPLPVDGTVRVTATTLNPL